MNNNISQAVIDKQHGQSHCTVEGCGRELYAGGYCKGHYLEWWKSLRDGQRGEAEATGQQEA